MLKLSRSDKMPYLANVIDVFWRCMKVGLHMGITLNGMHQPICAFLGKGPPLAIANQVRFGDYHGVISFCFFADAH